MTLGGAPDGLGLLHVFGRVAGGLRGGSSGFVTAMVGHFCLGHLIDRSVDLVQSTARIFTGREPQSIQRADDNADCKGNG